MKFREKKTFYCLHRYIGVQTSKPPTAYTIIQRAILMEIENTTVRSPRQPAVIFQAIEALNLKFSGKINEKPINPFPEQYFTCGVHCASCDQRCDQSMGHSVEGKPHTNSRACRYQHQYENKVFLCRQCHRNGREVTVRLFFFQHCFFSFIKVNNINVEVIFMFAVAHTCDKC